MGIRTAPSLELPSVQQVKSFTEEVGCSGKWNGEALEDFVVRTTIRASESSSDAAAQARAKVMGRGPNAVSVE